MPSLMLAVRHADGVIDQLFQGLQHSIPVAAAAMRFSSSAER